MRSGEASTAALAALAAAFAGALAGCSSNEDDGKLAVFHARIKAEPRSLDPALAEETPELEVAANLYEPLYHYAYLRESPTLAPLLAADRPAWSADGKTLTIRIESGVKYHESPCFEPDSKSARPPRKDRVVRADDFIYAIKRLADPRLKSRGWWYFEGRIVGLDQFRQRLSAPAGASPTPQPSISPSDPWSAPIEGLTTLDEVTIQIKLTQPYPQLAHILAQPFTAPLPREAVEACDDKSASIGAHDLGTGPFALEEWKKGRSLSLQRYREYRHVFYPTEGDYAFRRAGLLTDAGALVPFVDRVLFHVVGEERPHWQAFMNGRFDVIMPQVPRDHFQEAIIGRAELAPEFARKGMRLSIEPSSTFFFIAMNMKDPVLGSNKHLRRAISSAIDRQKWLEIFANNRGKLMNTVSPIGLGAPGHTGAPPPLAEGAAALEEAKAALTRAGYPGGKGLPELRLDFKGADSVNQQIGQFLAQQLARVGIRVTVHLNTFDEFTARAAAGRTQLMHVGWLMDYPDPENAYRLLYGPLASPGPNEASFNHPEFNRLYEKLTALPEGEERAETARKLEVIARDEMPWAYGYQLTQYQILQPWVGNFRAGDYWRGRYKYVKIDREMKRKHLEAKTP